jgi:hypothetical protein
VSGAALFLPDGDRYLPSDFARGPWSPDALHGGPVAALLARAVEAVPAEETMHVARMTVELLRPVPVTPLTVSATVARPGRKVQLVDVRLASDDRELAWCRALRIRRLEDDSVEAKTLVGTSRHDPTPAPPGPDEVHRRSEPARSHRAFHSEGAEMRWAAGEFDRRGPATVWVRLALPVVPGEEPSPLQRVAAAADFGNGISSVLDFESHLFINPDLTIYLERPAVGEWICLDARTTLGTPGVGLAQCALWDIDGPLGSSIQSLMIEKRA